MEAPKDTRSKKRPFCRCLREEPQSPAEILRETRRKKKTSAKKDEDQQQPKHPPAPLVTPPKRTYRKKKTPAKKDEEQPRPKHPPALLATPPKRTCKKKRTSSSLVVEDRPLPPHRRVLSAIPRGPCKKKKSSVHIDRDEQLTVTDSSEVTRKGKKSPPQTDPGQMLLGHHLSLMAFPRRARDTDKSSSLTDQDQRLQPRHLSLMEIPKRPCQKKKISLQTDQEQPLSRYRRAFRGTTKSTSSQSDQDQPKRQPRPIPRPLLSRHHHLSLLKRPKKSFKKKNRYSEYMKKLIYIPQSDHMIHYPGQKRKFPESEEEEIFNTHGKLFSFSCKEGFPQWKARGTSTVKLLKHKKKGTIRLLMRRINTLKICVNHYITPLMQLRRHAWTNRTWVWCVRSDFADESSRHEVLAIQYPNVKFARLFKLKFDQCRKELKEREIRLARSKGRRTVASQISKPFLEKEEGKVESDSMEKGDSKDTEETTQMESESQEVEDTLGESQEEDKRRCPKAQESEARSKGKEGTTSHTETGSMSEEENWEESPCLDEDILALLEAQEELRKKKLELAEAVTKCQERKLTRSGPNSLVIQDTLAEAASPEGELVLAGWESPLMDDTQGESQETELGLSETDSPEDPQAESQELVLSETDSPGTETMQLESPETESACRMPWNLEETLEESESQEVELTEA